VPVVPHSTAAANTSHCPLIVLAPDRCLPFPWSELFIVIFSQNPLATKRAAVGTTITLNRLDPYPRNLR
jgi:hypothetical protein